MRFLLIFYTILLLLIPSHPLAAQTVKDTAESYDGQNKFKDRSQWSQVPKEIVDWYQSQRITDATKKRLSLGYWSCCDNGDTFKTRFRVVEDGSKYGAETYEYFKDDRWLLIHPDVVQRRPTPDGQPKLFLRGGKGEPVCFIIDKEGI